MRKGQGDIEELVKLYFNDNLSTTEISKIKGYSINTISRRLRENGYKLRNFSTKDLSKYTIDEKYFSKIDSFDKAYFLGLLYADGYIDDINRGVKITLQETDVDILESLKKYTQYTGDITCVYNKKYERCYYAFQSYNSNFYMSALESGLTTKKSNTLMFPSTSIIPLDLMSHFMRGYFDGDGCIHLVKDRNNLKLSLVGTKEFLIIYQQILIDMLNISRRKLVYKSGVNTYCLQVDKKEDVLKVLQFLYKDSKDLKIQRKFNKYELYYT